MDDKFHRNAKVRSLRRLRGGRDALGAWVFWWSWCLDDPDLTGFVPSDELPSADEKAAELLVQVGLWDEVEGGYRFHDFDKYNPTREQLDAKRKADRERVAAKREATRENVASDTAAIPARVASTRDPIPSHPNPNPTERERAPTFSEPPELEHGEPPPSPVERTHAAKLWDVWCKVAANGAPMGSPPRAELFAAWDACAARNAANPCVEFERAAVAFCAEQRAKKKVLNCRWLCNDIGQYLEDLGAPKEPVPAERRLLT